MVEGKDTVVFEKLRIVEEVGKVYYEALVEGQNDGLPVRFELADLGPRQRLAVLPG